LELHHMNVANRLRGKRRGGEPGLDPHTQHCPAATASLMRSLAPSALAGSRQEGDPQIPLGSA
jgi:hypothetical protein